MAKAKSSIKKTKKKDATKDQGPVAKTDRAANFQAFFKSLDKSKDFDGELQASFLRINKQEVIPTGYIGLDYGLLSAGGMPIGKVVELYGPSGGSKSTVSMITAASYVKRGKTVMYVDTENAMNYEYAEALGVDVSSGLFVIVNPGDGEEAVDSTAAALDADAVDLIVIDSMKNLTPKKMKDGGSGDHEMGKQALLIAKMWQILIQRIGKSKATMIVINQTRANIGAMFGPTEKSTGGQSTEFYVSVRLYIGKSIAAKNQIKSEDGKTILGRMTTIRAEKNRMGISRPVTMKLMLGEGYCRYHDLISNAIVPLGVIKETGNKRWSYTDKNGVEYKWHGEGQIEDTLRENDELFKELYIESLRYFELAKEEVRVRAKEQGEKRIELVNSINLDDIKKDAKEMFQNGKRVQDYFSETESSDADDVDLENLEEVEDAA